MRLPATAIFELGRGQHVRLDLLTGLLGPRLGHGLFQRGRFASGLVDRPIPSLHLLAPGRRLLRRSYLLVPGRCRVDRRSAHLRLLCARAVGPVTDNLLTLNMRIETPRTDMTAALRLLGVHLGLQRFSEGGPGHDRAEATRSASRWIVVRRHTAR